MAMRVQQAVHAQKIEFGLRKPNLKKFIPVPQAAKSIGDFRSLYVLSSYTYAHGMYWLFFKLKKPWSINFAMNG